MATSRVRSVGVGSPDRTAMQTACRLAALALMSASAALSRLAVRMESREAASEKVMARLEFHGDRDGADGGLYLDGLWVARLPGVKRL